MDKLFDFLDVKPITDPGDTVHSNTHCNALVENPFAWEDENDAESEA